MKLPFTLGIKFVFRILLPGFVLSMALLPILRTLIDLTERVVPLDYLFVLSILVFGWLIVVLDMPIYMLFEGRRFWPKLLRDFFTSRERIRLAKLEKIILECRETDRRRYIEASVEIRRFPLDEIGLWDVRFPTRLGNLLTAYEEHSKEVYGMWQGFYWPRIWLRLDKDLREEIDSRQALADSCLYTVFALYISCTLCLFYAALYLFGFRWLSYLPRSPFYWTLPLLCFGLGYFIYRQSLHVHAQFGETFKAVFDQYGYQVMFPHIVTAISDLCKNTRLKTAPVEEQNMAVWFYLHNHRIKCPECSRVMLPIETAGHKCVTIQP